MAASLRALRVSAPGVRLSSLVSGVSTHHAALTTSVRELLRVRDTESGGQRGVLDAATLQSTSSAGEAIDIILDRELSGLVVLTGSAVAGLVTERDLLRYAGTRDARVEQAMIPLKDVHCVSPSDSVKTCIDLCMARVCVR